MSKSWWVVMALQTWEALQLNGEPIKVAEDSGAPTRWLPVFDDLEKAEAWADGKPVMRAIE